MSANLNQGVYLIHFDRKLHHAAHYVGYADDVAARWQQHLKGTGARLTQVLNQLGIGYKIVRVFYGESRKFERKLKNTNHTKHYCPICSGRTRPYNPKGLNNG